MAHHPTTELYEPVVLSLNALLPIAVFTPPFEFIVRAQNQKATLKGPVRLACKAPLP